MLDEPTGAAALRAPRGADELAEHASRDLLQAAAPTAARACGHLSPRLHTVAATRSARHRDLERHARRRPTGRVGELDLDFRGHVTTARSGATHPSPEQVVAEEGAEEIADVAEVEVPWREAAGTEPCLAVTVVELPRLGVREHLVGLGDLAE